MMIPSLRTAVVLSTTTFAMVSVYIHPAAAAEAKSLINLAVPGMESRFIPTNGANGQVTVTRNVVSDVAGAVIDIAPGPAEYPAVYVKPTDGSAAWDLSAYDHVAFRLTNVGSTHVFATVRIDNAGNWQDNPWNAEIVDLQPGQSTTLRVVFGSSYGQPGFKLNAAAVTQVLVVTGKADVHQRIRVESIVAGQGTPPKNGVIFGGSAEFDPVTQVAPTGVALKYDRVKNSLLATYSSQNSGNSFSIKPQRGRWDLSNATQVRVKLTNMGTTPVSPTIQVMDWKQDGTDAVAPANTIPVGGSAEIVVPFAAKTPFVGQFYADRKVGQRVPGTGTRFESDTVASVKIGFAHATDAQLLVQSVLADAPPVDNPAWLGQRPPVDGNWVKTLDESFTAPAIDKSKWNITGINPWDKVTHFSKDNLLLKPGSVTLRYEKRRGFHNDDPNQSLLNNDTSPRVTDYVCGYLDSSQRWTQRYGYFEAKVKLPTAPGLWPAFWMMPAGWDTGHNGMEFDIMEHLDRWGPYRYNIAMHWDGYAEQHKVIGYGNVYAQTDRSGFITAGLLWLPGVAVYYCNGKEVARWENPRISSVASFFLIEMTSGGWDNNLIDDTKLPADFTIEYVRAWQRTDLARIP